MGHPLLIRANNVSENFYGKSLTCLEAVRMPPEVNGYSRKPQRPIGMVRKEGQGYVISLQIYTDSHGGVYGQGWALRMIRTPQGQ